MTKTDIANIALTRLGEPQVSDVDTSTAPSAQAIDLVYDLCRDGLLRSHPWNFAVRRKFVEPVWVTITNVTNSGGLFLVTATSHGRSTGDSVTIELVTGTIGANGTWVITVVNANTFTLDGSTFTGTYISGGRLTEAPAFGWSYKIDLPTSCLRVLDINDDDGLSDPSDFEIENGVFLTDASENNVRYVIQVTDTALFDPLFCHALALKLAAEVCTKATGSREQTAAIIQEFESLMAPAARKVDAGEPRPRLRKLADESEFVRARFQGV